MDTKQLDLLKKLTKLANHNPNDHEANSAARRVCKMLEAVNFTLNGTSQQEPVRPNQAQYKRPKYHPWDDYFNNPYRNSDSTWDDEIKKAAEQTRRKQEEEVRRKQKEWIKVEEERLRKEHERINREKYEEFKKVNIPYQDTKEHGFYTRSGIRNLKCRKCGTAKETAFVGYADAFICNECWFKIV